MPVLRAGVPKTAIYEDRKALSREYDVRSHLFPGNVQTKINSVSITR